MSGIAADDAAPRVGFRHGRRHQLLDDQAQLPGDAAVGMLILGLVAVGMATNFIGLAVILPWLGHASWHAYRGLIERE